MTIVNQNYKVFVSSKCFVCYQAIIIAAICALEGSVVGSNAPSLDPSINVFLQLLIRFLLNSEIRFFINPNSFVGVSPSPPFRLQILIKIC